MPSTDRPTALVLRTAGTNCEGELCRAFQLAGADAELVHLSALVADPQRLEKYQLIGFPGGFSHGDDIGAGRVMAMRIRERLYPALAAAAQRGVCMIGVCNGFQVLTQTGLLPGPGAGEDWPDRPAPNAVTLAENASGRFVDTWVGVRANADSPCVWTRHLRGSSASDEVNQLPVAHGEGRLVAPLPETIDQLEASGQAALYYAKDINGSQGGPPNLGGIAGICDASGRIFGLMPHPERYLSWNHHPYATRLPQSLKQGATPGLGFFRSAVEAVTGAAATA
jgi:phosphoribosylformylglycinamidine synthase subunit PurQ / glutaminase